MTFSAVLAVVLACSDGPTAPPIADEIATAGGTPAAKLVEAEDTLRDEAASSGPQKTPIGVEIRTHSISPLYRTFLADPRGLEILGLGLSGLVPSPGQVFVSYNSEEAFGLIALRVPPMAGLVPAEDQGWSVARVDEAFQTLHAFREHLGGNFDLRLASFRIAVQFVRGSGTCSLLPEDDRNPETVAECVQVGRERTCGSVRDGLLTVSDSDRGKLSACFR